MAWNSAGWCLTAAVCWVVMAAPAPLKSAVAQQKHYVELQVMSSSRSGIDQNQRWLEVLSDVGADNVTLSQAQGDRMKAAIEKTDGRVGATYKVIGYVNDRNQLVLPGGKYSLRDKAAIRQLVQQIRDDGAEVALAEKMAFGLTAEQLVALHEDLAATFAVSTRDLTPAQVLAEVKRNITTPMLIESAAQRSLRNDYRLQDELTGMSCGTALAAALRPLGLVAAPRRQPGKSTEILITGSQQAEEHWPIGWPLQQRPSQAAPKLFERVPANIQNFELGKALSAIQKDVGLPFLIDYNSLAREGIELDKIRVNLQSEKISYQIVLQRIVAQARPRMEMEIRADEAGQPFIWFSAR